MNATEFFMMLEHGVFPEFMRRLLGGELHPDNEEVVRMWNVLCRAYHQFCMKSQGGTWHMVHYPCGLSVDGAGIHKYGLDKMSTPRVPLLDQAQALFEEAYATFGNDLQQQVADKAARVHRMSTVVSRYQTLANPDGRGRWSKARVAKWNTATALIRKFNDMTVVELYVDVHMQRQYTAAVQEVADALMTAALRPYLTAITNFQATHHEGASFEAIFMRKMALHNPKWRCILPEQRMPLGVSTPDLHQTAEMLVGTNKKGLRAWTIKPRQGADLKLTKSYDDALQALVATRNQLDQGNSSKEKRAILRSIRRSWITFQIIARPAGEWFRPQLAPGDMKRGGNETAFVLALFWLVASGGEFTTDAYT